MREEVPAGVAEHVLPPEFLVTLTPAVLAFLSLYINISNEFKGGNVKDAVWNGPLVYRPIRKQLEKGPDMAGVFSSVAQLDVTLALGDFFETIKEGGNPATFPDVSDDDRFQFSAENLKNPLLALAVGSSAVGNSVQLGTNGQRLTFLTGPNSGGKSTLSKAIIHSQILAQIGGPVVADHLTTSIADGMTYHVPLPPDQSDQTGRFGFELERVREIIDKATPRSLTILDDCLDGTTHQERIEILENVMAALNYKGGNTVFSTHAHEVVDAFQERGIGQFLEVEYGEEGPTYRVKPGISQSSHAREIAEKHGLSREQVRQEILKATGEIPDWL